MHDTTMCIDFETDASALRRGPTGTQQVLHGASRGRASAGYSRVLERVLTGTRAGTRRGTRGKRKGGRLDHRVLRGYSGVLDHGVGDGDEDAGAVVRGRRALRRQRCTPAQSSSRSADRTATERRNIVPAATNGVPRNTGTARAIAASSATEWGCRWPRHL